MNEIIHTAISLYSKFHYFKRFVKDFNLSFFYEKSRIYFGINFLTLMSFDSINVLFFFKKIVEII